MTVLQIRIFILSPLVAAALGPRACSPGPRDLRDGLGLLQSAASVRKHVQTPPEEAGDQCGVLDTQGSGRRRCTRSSKKCIRDPDRACRFFRKKSRLNIGSGCSVYGKVCDGTSFCALNKTFAVEIAGRTPSGRSGLSCCFGRMGGYNAGLPEWYTNSHYKNKRMCIDEEMTNEMTICENEAVRSVKAARNDFVRRLNLCARAQGARKFVQLLNRCSNPDILAKIEECRDNVTREIMGIEAPATTMPAASTPEPTTAPPETTAIVTTEGGGLAPSQCGAGSGGSGRRRCPVTRRCMNDRNAACNVFTKKSRPLPDLGNCRAYPKRCGTTTFCGINGSGVDEIAADRSGKSPLACCFLREGGYSDVPDWFVDRDYRNKSKCIDAQMMSEMTVCLAEATAKQGEKIREFKRRMNACTRERARKPVTILLRQCQDAAVLRTMEECRDSVTAEMKALAMPEPQPETTSSQPDSTTGPPPASTSQPASTTAIVTSPEPAPEPKDTTEPPPGPSTPRPASTAAPTTPQPVVTTPPPAPTTQQPVPTQAPPALWPQFGVDELKCINIERFDVRDQYECQAIAEQRRTEHYQFNPLQNWCGAFTVCHKYKRTRAPWKVFKDPKIKYTR